MGNNPITKATLSIPFPRSQARRQLYLLDAYKLSHYRDGVGTRAKTDLAGARLILRYLTRELDELKPWTPPHDAFEPDASRAVLVQLSQSLQDIPEIKQAARQLASISTESRW